MIRTESEYQKAVQQLEQERDFMQKQRESLKELGLAGADLERAMHPSMSFHEQLKEEVEAYENIKRGELGTLRSLNSLGRWLIGARIAKGWNQKELAQHLGVSEAQVSRDERNEYYGVKVSRAQAILEAMDFHFTMHEDEEATPLVNAEFEKGVGPNFEIPLVPPAEIPGAFAGYLRANPNIDKDMAESLSKALTQIFEEEVANTKEGI